METVEVNVLYIVVAVVTIFIVGNLCDSQFKEYSS